MAYEPASFGKIQYCKGVYLLHFLDDIPQKKTLPSASSASDNDVSASMRPWI